jgi:hydrogenase expression/formation protein HypC
MCVAIPARITEITEGVPGVPRMARVDRAGRPDQCCLSFLPEAKVGEYVLVQSGFAVELLDAETAAESLAAFLQVSAMTIPTPLLPSG